MCNGGTTLIFVSGNPGFNGKLLSGLDCALVWPFAEHTIYPRAPKEVRRLRLRGLDFGHTQSIISPYITGTLSWNPSSRHVASTPYLGIDRAVRPIGLTHFLHIVNDGHRAYTVPRHAVKPPRGRHRTRTSSRIYQGGHSATPRHKATPSFNILNP